MQTRNLQIPSNLISELNIPQIIDITDDLPKLGTRGWYELESPRDINALTDIVWHHSGEWLSEECTAATHAKNHVDKNEGGFPYHIYIKNGQIIQGNDLLTKTYGVSSNNYQTVHCCVEGCYSPVKDPVTQITTPADVLSDENWRAMIGVELTLRQILPKYTKTNGHNYYKSTLCPGYSMTKFRESVTEVQQRLDWKQSKNNQEALAYQIAQTILWTYNTAKGLDQYGKPTVDEGGKEWARQRLLLLEPVMREHGFL